MNSSKGKQPAQRSKQPTKRTKQPSRTSVKQPARSGSASKQQRTAYQATKRPTASRPSASSNKKASVKVAGGSARGKNPAATKANASRSTASHSTNRGGHGRSVGSRKADLWTRISSSRIAIVAIVVVCAVALVGVFDTATNWGKAYGNVSINGVDVGGKTADEMLDLLKDEFGARVSHAQVTIYADEEAQARAAQGSNLPADDDSVAEQLSADDSYELVDSWQVDALSLKASVPYEEAIENALAVGRADGGIVKRFNLLVGQQDVPLGVSFDESLVEELSSQIDLTIGNPRVDTTVEVVDGTAEVVEGHSGLLVDRKWLEDMISRAMISGDVPDSFVAKTTEAQSRISSQQAADMAEAINRAIGEGVLFSYQGRTWLAGPVYLGDWTKVSIVGEDGNWSLSTGIDSSQAIPVVVDKVGAEITADEVLVTYEQSDSGIRVHTEGTGNIPEVSSAVEHLQSILFGPEGIAWGSGVGEAATIEISESDRPETLSFEDAVNLGVITVIGECTTEFTNIEGTENRNHNIKLAADILNDAVIEADGGRWSFNDRAGDTDEASGFWTAGSIVDGEYVDSVGGGICQVATTVFNSVLEAGLEVIERHNHTLYIASYPTGRDAAIDYPTDLDLEWENGLDSDVLLKMSYTDTSVTAQLYSVYTGYSSEYEVGDWEEGEKYRTLFEEDDSLADGYYYRKSVGEDGSKITVTRYVTDSKGASVRVDAFQSNYEAKDEVYVVGPNVDTGSLSSGSGAA